jgi:hypothetical protein
MGEKACRMSISIHSANLQDYYTMAYQLSHENQTQSYSYALYWRASSFGISTSRNDKNASALVFPGATWLTLGVVEEGIEIGSVVPDGANSDAGSVERVGAYGGMGLGNSFTEPMWPLAVQAEERVAN